MKEVLPRLIRLRNASGYLGMDRHRFDKEVRPFLTEIPIGIQGIAFDRLDLDQWVDYYKQRNGRPPKNKRIELGDAKDISTKNEFEKLLEQIRSKKRKKGVES